VPHVAKTVGDIMDREVHTVAPETSVETVLHLLREHGLPGVPVVNSAGRCVGMITEADLVLPDEDGDLHLPHYVNIFGGTVFLEPLRRFEDRIRKAFASKARDLMSENPDTVTPDTSIDDAARLIHETGHNRLPVVEHGQLVGLVTRIDVLGALVS
jgi:CBS domain-containing protein